MEILRRAPMLAILAALVSGLALYDKIGGAAFIVAVPLIFSGVMFLSYENELPGQWKIFFCGLVIALICSIRLYSGIFPPQIESRVINNASGTVESIRTWGRTYIAVINIDNHGRFITGLPFAIYLPGDRIKFNGAVRPLKISRDKGFNEARYWGARDVTGWVNMYDVEELPQKFSLALMRQKISRSLGIYATDLTGKYLKAAWLGERVDSLSKAHRKWGTSHLLAVSGFHVGMFILCLSFLLGKNILLLSLFMWLYIFLTGAAPSAMRAGLMIQTGLIALLLGRPVSAVNSVSLAGVILLLYSPLYFWDIGYRLSVLSALVICAIGRKKFMWLLISPVAALVTFPQVAYTFGGVPLVGLVLNLFAPLYFAFAFSIASVFEILRAVHVPLSLFAVEGIFKLWEFCADYIAGLIPYVVEYNIFIAWLGSGTFLYFICRYFDFAVARIFAVMLVGSFAAFMMFL